MMSGWAHHIEPIKGTRHADYHTRIGQCQQNSAEFRYDSSSAHTDGPGLPDRTATQARTSLNCRSSVHRGLPPPKPELSWPFASVRRLFEARESGGDE